MDLNHPDFLAPPTGSRHNSFSNSSGPKEWHKLLPTDPLARRLSVAESSLSPNLPSLDFDLLLSTKLASMDAARTVRGPFAYPHDLFPPDSAVFGTSLFDPFNLPTELQGGVGHISLRRPSYAAELFTRSSDYCFGNRNSLATLAAANNLTLNASNGGLEGNNGSATNGRNPGIIYSRDPMNRLASDLESFNLNSNFNESQVCRPSQVAANDSLNYDVYKGLNSFSDFMQGLVAYFSPPLSAPLAHNPNHSSKPYLAAMNNKSAFHRDGDKSRRDLCTEIDDGIMVRDQRLVTLPELRALYAAVYTYYLDPRLADTVLLHLRTLHRELAVQRLITSVRSMNNISCTQKCFCLVVNKNGKLDLLSYSAATNLCLRKDDLVIVDGDRGVDMVMILDPSVSLNNALLFNFLKKQEHLKLLTIQDAAGKTSVKGDKVSSDDNEMVVTLPTKQILRFALPEEVYLLGTKIQEERRAFFTCYNKIQELGLGSVLELINVEYQSDFKKLIFYYFANFKRVDFRLLIKEMFKVFKTRIWLCAVLPAGRRDLYHGEVMSMDRWVPSRVQDSNARLDGAQKHGKGSVGSVTLQAGVPPEYTLPEGTFTVQMFKTMPSPTYFHLQNMLNLMANLLQDIQGPFYGFNQGN